MEMETDMPGGGLMVGGGPLVVGQFDIGYRHEENLTVDGLPASMVSASHLWPHPAN